MFYIAGLITLFFYDKNLLHYLETDEYGKRVFQFIGIEFLFIGSINLIICGIDLFRKRRNRNIHRNMSYSEF
jgi:hypothetical protein